MTDEVIWIYYETDKPEYFLDPKDKEISITVYGTIRTTKTTNIESVLTGPIEDPNPNHKPKSVKPVNTALSRTVFWEVGCFSQVIKMGNTEWPYDGKYQLQATYGGVQSKPITFFVNFKPKPVNS